MYLRALNARKGAWKCWKRPFRRLEVFCCSIHIVTGNKRNVWLAIFPTVLVPKLCKTSPLGVFTGPMRMHGGQQLSWWKGCKSLVGTLVMTGLLHRKSWANDMADKKRNERSPLNTVGIRKAIQWSFEPWKTYLRTSSICADGSRNFSLHLLSVTRETSLYILSGAPGESDTTVVWFNESPEDEGFQTVKNYVGDKELNELIFGQFLQPRISSPRAIASTLKSKLQGKGCSLTCN